MLCSMCQHGTTKTWKCRECGDSHCLHSRSCKCGNTYRRQTMEESNLTQEAKDWLNGEETQ